MEVWKISVMEARIDQPRLDPLTELACFNIKGFD
jgi:hypothetical protein